MALRSLDLEWSLKEGVSRSNLEKKHEREVQGLGMTLSSHPHMTSVQQRSNEHKIPHLPSTSQTTKTLCMSLYKLLPGIICYWTHAAPGIFLMLDHINWRVVWTSFLSGIPSPTDGRDHAKGNDLIAQSPSLSCARCKYKHW